MTHVTWECKYHVVIVPKYRQKVFYGKMRKRVGKILRELCRQKDVEMIEGTAAVDHIHMLLIVPPKYSIAMTMGFLKGKSAIRINRDVMKAKGSLQGRKFWARGYCVSTVGFDEATIRQYVKRQEKQDRAEDGQLDLDFE